MRKNILLLLSVFVVSLLLFSCTPKQSGLEENVAEGAEVPEQAGVTTTSGVEIEADLEKLSLEELDKVIAVGEADKDKPLSQQAYNNPEWLTIAYKVKAEKLEEAEQGTEAAEKLNHAPVFKDFSNKNGAENEEITFKVTATDEDGDVLTYDVKDDPPGADLDAKTGKFSWTPGYDKSGDYEMTFVVSDGKTTATKTITLTVANTNRPPKFTEEWELTNKLNIIVNEIETVFLEATDEDGDTLTYGSKSKDLGVKLDKVTGQALLEATKVEPLGYQVTFNVTDGVATIEKTLTVLAFPATCAKNIECPGEYYCQNSTSSCKAWDLTNVGGFTCLNSMNTAAAQDACVNKVINYWTDDTKGHNLCYKVDPVMTLNSCTVTQEMSGKYKYDCYFTATCDYSSLY